jgi:hypothetical protein
MGIDPRGRGFNLTIESIGHVRAETGSRGPARYPRHSSSHSPMILINRSGPHTSIPRHSTSFLSFPSQPLIKSGWRHRASTGCGEQGPTCHSINLKQHHKHHLHPQHLLISQAQSTPPLFIHSWAYRCHQERLRSRYLDTLDFETLAR